MKINNAQPMRFKQNSKLTTDKPTVFLLDVDGETVLELTLDQITAILKANGYSDPVLACPPEVMMVKNKERK